VIEMAHVAKWKEKEVSDLVELINSKPVVGIINIGGIPGPQLQKIRQNIGDKAHFKVSKNLLFTHALDEAAKSKKEIDNLKEFIDGQIGIILTEMNPFTLFRVLESTKTPAPASGGEIAPEDILIKQGDTSFKPGPIVGELQKVGIPAAIESGKVVIKSDKLLVKAGDKISPEVAQMLTKLGIFPIIVGLDLKGVYEEGLIYKRDVLDINIDEIKNNVSIAASQAFNLAFNSAIPLPVTIIPLLQKAHSQAFNLMYNADITMPETVKLNVVKAYNQMLSLSSHVKDGLDDELKNKLGISKD
jgi:large subunit ribosomal protein L10